MATPKRRERKLPSFDSNKEPEQTVLPNCPNPKSTEAVEQTKGSDDVLIDNSPKLSGYKSGWHVQLPVECDTVYDNYRSKARSMGEKPLSKKELIKEALIDIGKKYGVCDEDLELLLLDEGRKPAKKKR